MIKKVMIEKYMLKPVFCFLFAIIFAFMPIKIGNEANKNIPIIGAIEKASEDYTKDSLVKVTAAYGVSKIINKGIAMIQRVEISVTPFGVGASFAPGELLASAGDTIDRVANALFLVLGVLLVQKVLIGMISFVCLKCFLPIGLFLYGYFYLAKKFFPNMQHLNTVHAFGKFFVRFALIIWLIFPVTAYINKFLESSYIGSEYSQLQQSLEKDSVQFNAIAQEISGNNIEEQSAEEKGAEEKLPSEDNKEEGFFSWFTKPITEAMDNVKEFTEEIMGSVSSSNIAELADNSLNYVDSMIDDLFIVLSIFLVTNILVPLGAYVLIAKLYQLLQQDVTYQVLVEKLHEINNR